MNKHKHLGVALLLAGVWAGGARPVTAQEGIAVGAKAPAVSLKTLDGTVVNLATYLGKKPVVLEWWASWCGNCEELLPKVKAAQAAVGADVVFLGINVTVNQTKERAQRYIAEHKPPFLTLWDDGGVSARAYGVPATSYIVVVDRTGKVVYTGVGGSQDVGAAVKLAVAK